LESQRGVRITALAAKADQLSSLDATHPGYLHGTGLLRVGVFGDFPNRAEHPPISISHA
jgi:hypothetical protein